MNYNVIAQSEESTVLSEYIPQGKRAEGYQSEADLERELIKLLGELGYEYLPIHSEAELISNLRKKLEELNDYTANGSSFLRVALREKTTASLKRRGASKRTMCRFCTATTARRKTSPSSIRRISTTTACKSSTNMKIMTGSMRTVTTSPF